MTGLLPDHIETWLDENSLCWGDGLTRSLSTAITIESDFVVGFLDKYSLTDWVKQEIDWALGKEAELDRPFLLPVLVPPYPTERQLQPLGDRIALRLAAHDRASVEQLASQLATKLFQLIARNLDKLTATSADHDNGLPIKIRALVDRLLPAFLPDIIVGIPRAGLAVASILAKNLGSRPTVPVISLWPHPRFDNPYNRIAFTAADIEPVDGTTRRILVVDDVCRSGRTLDDARTFLARRLEPGAFTVETAAVTFQGRYAGAVPPTFYVDRTYRAIRDVAGDYEQPLA